MAIKEKIALLFSIALIILIEVQGADKYTDGNRPYEFGFSIDGEQHRHEKKDEKGLIMGEFGFITADGVYHVTVYATDEQGRFKILSMKNIRKSPYPTYTSKQAVGSARQGHSLEQPAPQVSSKVETTTAVVATTRTTTFKPISIEPPANSCSHCSLPKPSTPAPAPVIPVLNPSINTSPNQIKTVDNPKTLSNIKPQSASVSQQNGASIPFPQQRFGVDAPQNINSPQNYPQSQNSLNVPQVPSLAKELVPPQTPNFLQQNPGPGLSSPQGPASINSAQPRLFEASKTPQQGVEQPLSAPAGPQSNYPTAGQSVPNSVNGVNLGPNVQNPEQSPVPIQNNIVSGRTPKLFNVSPSPGSVSTQPNSILRSAPSNPETISPKTLTKPTLISAQMQIVDKNTDIHRLSPGEKHGLPQGVTTNDMTNLLYTFNYTVGFHGHFEEGYTNGAKQGYYFVTGRNGVRTRVDYTADSTGFHPKISQEVLDLLSDDVPKPETEKEEKYGLKGYEFKWLYYPVEAKGR